MLRGKYFPCLGDHCESLLFDGNVFELLTSHSWLCEPDKGLVDLKLTLSFNDMDTVHFASLAILVHLESDSKRQTVRALESELVESYMRTFFAVPEYQAYMRTGYYSEPCLVEAAAKALLGRAAFQILCHNAKAIQSGFTARGEHGELASLYHCSA